MKAETIRRAIFLDRDGTISSDEFGYITDPAAYHLFPNTGEALRLLRSLGYYLFIVTNQSGIARGWVSLEQLNSVHARMRELLLGEGVTLDRIFYSPYFKDGVIEPYNVQHEDRKPGLGMFKTAKQEFDFDTRQSWMVGDRYSDVAFGKKAGLRTILLLTGNGRKEMLTGFQGWDYEPDFVTENILTAAALIERLS